MNMDLQPHIAIHFHIKLLKIEIWSQNLRIPDSYDAKPLKNRTPNTFCLLIYNQTKHARGSGFFSVLA